MVANCLIIALILGGAFWIGTLFFHFGNVEYTNNAQVRQDLVTVNARIQGYVSRIYVDEFQQVRKGDTLMVVEDAQYRLEVARAEAALQMAESGLEVQRSTVVTAGNAENIQRANMEEVRVRMVNARRDYERYQTLFAQDAVTRQQMEAKQTDYEALRANYKSLLSRGRGARLNTSEQQQRVGQNAAGIEVARAALHLAQLNLGYTVITAPCNGYTARRMVQEGELVQPGQKVFTLVSTDKVWIVANLKESQLKNVEIGRRVRIKIDAVSEGKFSGTVIAISDATGAQYSPTPTDNAAGNFVKVEGRIPVKIGFTDVSDSTMLARLRSGMNAEIEIEKE